MLFSKDINLISFDDIRELVDVKVPENQVLEYKREFSSDEVAKDISAMANTFGGYFIYGVRCERGSSVPEGLENIDDPNVENTIESICISRIDPPVICPIKRVSDSETGRSVVVVKVPESDLSPHTINSGKDTYVRIMSQNRPLPDRASLDRILWLVERRRKSVELRESTLTRLREYTRRGITSFSADLDIEMELLVFPEYPRERTVQLSDLHSVISQVKQEMATRMTFQVQFRPVHAFDGGIGLYGANGNLQLFVLLNELGFCKVSIVERPQIDQNNWKNVPAGSLGSNLAAAIAFGFGMAERSGIRGGTMLRTSIKGLSRSELTDVSGYDIRREEFGPFKCILEQEINVESRCESGDFDRARIELFEETFSRVAHVYGKKLRVSEWSSRVRDSVNYQLARI